MALFLFAPAIAQGRPIKVFNDGDMARDFTFVDDVAGGILRVLDRVASSDPQWSSDAPCPGSSSAPHRPCNMGNSSPVVLGDLIEELESALGRSAQKKFLRPQAGDMQVTLADVRELERDTGDRPNTDLHDGIRAFADWFCENYGIDR